MTYDAEYLYFEHDWRRDWKHGFYLNDIAKSKFPLEVADDWSQRVENARGFIAKTSAWRASMKPWLDDRVPGQWQILADSLILLNDDDIAFEFKMTFL